MLEGKLPFSIAESPVQPAESRIITLVAPSKLSVHQFNLFQLTGVKSSPELAHETKVEVSVALVSRLINEVEIAKN